MSTVTGCVLFLPAAYATNQETVSPIRVEQDLPSHIKDSVIFQETDFYLRPPILISGPYNFDPTLSHTLPQTEFLHWETESLDILGQPKILKEAQQDLSEKTFESEQDKRPEPVAQFIETPEDGHVQNKQVNDTTQQDIISQKLYKIAEKEIDQLERQKIQQLEQLENKYKSLEKKEATRLKQIERDLQKNMRIAEIEKEQLARLGKIQQIKQEKEKLKQDKLAIKEKNKQDALAKKQEQKIAKSSDRKGSKEAFIRPVGFESNISRDTNKSGQLNQIAEGTALFKLFNGDQLSVTSGFNIYDQETVDRIHNIPVKVGWEHDINDYTISIKAGADLYDRLKAVPNFSIGAKKSIKLPKSWAKVFIVSAEIDHAQYKFNAETIENDIRYLRLKGSLFWQIKENTSFFTSAHFGTLNDGNVEHQVFSRLEQKFAKNFSVAGNLFIWGFSEDKSSTSGYFSPPDFLVYNGEVAWADEITDFLSCKVAISLGQQRAQGEWSNASSFNANCKTKISKNLEFALGYEFSNSFSDTNISDSAFFANRFTANVKAKF